MRPNSTYFTMRESVVTPCRRMQWVEGDRNSQLARRMKESRHLLPIAQLVVQFDCLRGRQHMCPHPTLRE
jgi:hypothetical protein